MEKLSESLQNISIHEISTASSKIDFTFKEYNIETKIKNNFKVFLPEQIGEYLKETDDNFTGFKLIYDMDKFDKLRTELLSGNSINLAENNQITDLIILKSVLCFFGAINTKNDFSLFTTDDYLSNISPETHIDKFTNNPQKKFSDYIDENKEVFFNKFKIKDLEKYVSALKYFGIDLNAKNSNGNSNLIYINIQNYVMSMNKILLVITPSNNFWISSDKTTINNVNYDKRKNNYSVVYYNWPFIKKFYDRIANHPRCTVGYLNSMQLKNLKPCIDTLPLEIKNFTKFLLFDQGTHDNNNPNKKDKPNFIRNLSKIIKETDNSFNETNIVILESEKEKCENIKSNMINMNVFSEKYFFLIEEEKKQFNVKIDEMFDYLTKMLNECDTDVREYLAKNSI